MSVHDPWADPDEVRHEYGLDLLSGELAGSYDAVVLAVAHDKFKGLDWVRLKKSNGVTFDIKAFLGREQVDGRL